MKILALDTCAKTAAVCIADGNIPVASFTFHTETHSTTLLPMIENMLSLCSLSYSDIDMYAVSYGPGSFTGVRIGVSTVKGLAFRYCTPCVGVSATEAMAESFCGIGGIIVPVTDARRDMVYTAVFRSLEDGIVERLTDDMQVSTDELCALLRDYGDERVFFTGDAYDRMTTHEKRPVNTACTPTEMRTVSGFGVARAALAKWEKTDDKSVFTDAALLPVYLKKSQAEREREERISSGE